MKHLTVYFLFLSFLSSNCLAEPCSGFGPQTPRDLTSKIGKNFSKFSSAPSYSKMNLCNIHFHKNAEHKASGFSVSGGEGDFGGWKCNETTKLTSNSLKPIKANSCKNIEPGDTIEVHWVYSSCSGKPGQGKPKLGLGACLSDSCKNPQLRVESKVFLLVNEDTAEDFSLFSELNDKTEGYYQTKNLPDRKDALEFAGSTTGPKYNDQNCSPFQVTWNVSQNCQKLNINSLSTWCQNNAFGENMAHGVRQILRDPALLSPIEQ